MTRDEELLGAVTEAGVALDARTEKMEPEAGFLVLVFDVEDDESKKVVVAHDSNVIPEYMIHILEGHLEFLRQEVVRRREAEKSSDGVEH